MRKLLTLMTDAVAMRFLVVAGSQFGAGLIGFAATLFAVRSLGADGFGALALGLTIQAYAFIAVSFGTDIDAVRQLAREPSRLAEILVRVTLMRLLLALPAMLVLAGLALSGQWDRDESLVIGAFAVSVLFQATYPLWAPQGLERVTMVGALAVGGQVVNLALVALAATLDAPPIAFAGAKIGSDLILAVVAFAWARRRAGPLDWSVRPAEILAELRAVAPLGQAQLIRSAIISADLVVLSLFVADAAVGQFAVAFRIYTFILSLISAYFVVILPVFSREFARGGRDALSEVLTAALWRTLPPAVLCAAILAVFSKPILASLFGAEFVTAAPVLAILAAALVANLVHRTYRQVLLAHAEAATDLRNSATALGFKLVAMLALVPFLGMLGSAVAAFAGDLVLLWLQRRAVGRVLSSREPDTGPSQ